MTGRRKIEQVVEGGGVCSAACPCSARKSPVPVHKSTDYREAWMIFPSVPLRIGLGEKGVKTDGVHRQAR